MRISYYTHGGYPATGSVASSSGLRAELDSITAGFDKLPSFTGNANKPVVINAGETALSTAGGSLILGGNLTTSGAFTTTFAQGANITLTLPLVDGTVATLAGTETLTNKTISSPSITTPTGIVKADVGLGNVDNTSDATKNAASVSLTNKTIVAPAFSGTASGSLTNLSLTTPTITGVPVMTMLTTKGDTITATAASTPARFAAGADGTVAVAQSTATAGLAYAAVLNKGIYGLTTVNNGTDNVDISAGGAMDASGAYWMTGAASTKQSNVAWAVGSAAGCLDTGAVGNSPYYIWIIARSDTNVVDYLCSLSSTAPTMPTNYTFKRLIGWFNRSGGNIDAFLTYELAGGGLDYYWKTSTLDINLQNTLTTSRRTDALHVPLNFSVEATVFIEMDDASPFDTTIYNPDQLDTVPSHTAAPLANIRGQGTIASLQQLTIRTDATGKIAARSTNTIDNYLAWTSSFRWGRRN